MPSAIDIVAHSHDQLQHTGVTFLKGCLAETATILRRPSMTVVALLLLLGLVDCMCPMEASPSDSSAGEFCPGLQGSGASGDEVAHTCFLVNPEGELLASFGDDDTVINTSDAVASHIGNYKLHHPSWHGPKAIKVRHA